MTPKEMIEVLQAYERGEKIEERVNGTDQYVQVDEPIWDFYGSHYRIAPKVKEKQKYYACIDVGTGHLVFGKGDGSDHEHNPYVWIRVPALDQEVEIENE